MKCDNCEYSANTNIVLKRHMITKHKQKTLTPEKERSEESVKLVSLSPRGERFEPIPDFEQIEPVYDISSPALPHSSVISTNNSSNPNVLYICHICKKGFNESYDRTALLLGQLLYLHELALCSCFSQI